VLVNGRREWVWFEDIESNDEDFPKIGQVFDAAGLQTRGKVGQSEALFMRQRDLIDFAVPWMAANR
jgi:aminoglycoside 3-N-acetyltransferase